MEIGDGTFREIVDAVGDGVYVVNRARQIEFWSKGAELMSGYQREDVVGKRCRDNMLNHVDDAGVELCISRCPLQHTMRDGVPREARVWMTHADGHRQPVWVRANPLRDDSGQIVGAVEIFSDDSVIRAANARVAELEPLALSDPLTGMGNRRFVEAELDKRLDEWVHYCWSFGVLMVDIDHFKQVNDNYGHDVGDEALRLVSRTLSFGLGESDVVGRFGGEEFVVLVAHCDADGLRETAERLRALVAASRFVSGRTPISLTVSIGGSTARPGDDTEMLLRRVDGLMYEAKTSGRNRVVVDPDLMETPPPPRPVHHDDQVPAAR